MKMYNFEFRANHTNATITVSIRTDEGWDVAEETALQELKTALGIPAHLWDIEESSSEDY